ncbi:MAG: hypothetical protein KF830_08775 [Planctomycetes bacterium]|nr:hypothetical protein [Planctomycetota bacterium]
MRSLPAAVVLSFVPVGLVAQQDEGPHAMRYGPLLTSTVECGGRSGTTPKGLVVRGGDLGTVVFDTELLRLSAAWTDGWLRLRGTAYDGSHGPMPSRDGMPLVETAPGPGWAHAGSFVDPRPIPYGPLPRDWGRFRGVRLVAGDGVVVDYEVDDMAVRESFTWEHERRLVRTLELGPSARPQSMVVADGPWTTLGEAAVRAPGRFAMLQWSLPGPSSEGDRAGIEPTPAPVQQVFCALHGEAGPELAVAAGRILLQVPAHARAQRVQLVLARGDQDQVAAQAQALLAAREVRPLAIEPAAARWGAPIVTQGVRGDDDGPFAVDTITLPFDNPFHSRMRTAAFDFFADGRAAVSTWNGDVWIVAGLDDDLGRLEWRRFATGLFDPLGLRIVDDVVHVHGRDGITRLHDRNGDGEADHHECFNNDVLVTDSFHEFAFDLQTDGDGNFYFSKGAPVKPGGRGFTRIVPHHGTILKLARDGTRLETIATGLRAPNGIGVSAAGVITCGDNEGTYMPRCRLNWIAAPGFYGGVAPTAHRTPVPAQPDLPLCWMPMEVDNSSGGQVWVTGRAWADLDGRLLHLSYGTCSVYLVLMEQVAGQVQGGVVRLPAEFSSSCMRGRFAPHDGQLYVIGLQGWQTSAAREGGFHRVRRTSAPLGLPTALRTSASGVQLTFAEPLDVATATDPDSYGVEIWNYRYSSDYGSPEVSVLHPEREVERGKPNRDPLVVTGAQLSADRRTVSLRIDGMRPVHQMRITWNVDAADGRQQKGELHHTIHALAPASDAPTER